MACLQLLDLIVIAMHEKKELSVSKALALSEVGSPATIHKKLQILRDFDLVSASCSSGNATSDSPKTRTMKWGLLTTTSTSVNSSSKQDENFFMTFS
jgi:hypothetical protein